jgi:spore coat protein CotH
MITSGSHLFLLALLFAPADATGDFMDGSGISFIEINVAPTEKNALQANPRAYVRAQMTEKQLVGYRIGAVGTSVPLEVGVHLKGSAGSFRNFDDRPALTINMDKYKKKQNFHGMDKWHLNNSVQDGGYLHESMARWLFLKAGLPATRARHGWLRLNGRDLGLFVLVEGFDKPWLKRQFGRSDGNLYDGGFCQDLDGGKKLLEGSGTDQPDLKKVWAAMGEGDPVKRLAGLDALVDIDQVLAFAVMENFMAHWDGYVNNVNNYRIYFDPARAGKMILLPSGMDQMWGDPNFNIFGSRGALIAKLLECPGVRARYQLIMRKLHQVVHDVPAFNARVDAMVAGAKPMADLKGQAEDLKRRFATRALRVQQLLAELPEMLEFRGQTPVPLNGFTVSTEQGALKAEVVQESNRPILRIAGGGGVASFRKLVQLDAGAYRFEAQTRTRNVVGRQEAYTGAGIRQSGVSRTNSIVGSAGWTQLVHEFKVEQSGSVTLVLELRCQSGEAEFNSDSVRLIKVR